MQTRYAVAAMLTLACGAAPDAPVPGHSQRAITASTDFDVDFAGCTEFVGIGLVPEANARPLVPAQYELLVFGSDAVVVVRVADCTDVSVDGKPVQPLRTSQVGISLVGPDETADINNYTVWFATNSGQLQGRLSALGLDGALDAQLAYAFIPDGGGNGTLDVDVTPPQAPDFLVEGTAAVPTSAPTTFVASWWAEGVHGTVQMRTEFPNIRFSQASTTLSTVAGSELAALIGGTTLTFPVLDSYNGIASAEMEVTAE